MIQRSNLIIKWSRTDGLIPLLNRLWCDEVTDMKDNNKKEIKYLNVCMDKALHEEFEAFCKAHGMSKVGATEQAIRQYMDKMNKALKNVK